MKSELTQRAGAHNNREKCIPASLSKPLVVNPSYYCLGPGILIRFFITGVSAYCSRVTVNAIFAHSESFCFGKQTDSLNVVL